MSNTPINTAPIQQLIQQIKVADQSNQKEVRIDITTAKNVAYTLGIVMSRLAGNYEDLLSKKDKDEVIQVQMDGGKL
jgi:hypothetical protein